MREKGRRVEYVDNEYSYAKPAEDLKSKKRLDLNDLLKRAENQKKYETKISFLIFFIAVFVISMAVLIFSLI